jgi:predicted phage terminase large subunit-like protein
MTHIPAERLEEIKKMPMNVYILADFAYSQQLWADESAYIIVGVDGDANHYILESDSGKWGDTGTTAKIMDKVVEYKAQLRILGVETRGLGHVEKEINDLKRRHNLSFGFEELKPKNRTKPERIKSTISLFDNHQIFIIDGKNKKFEEQASRFRGEKMDHGDDIIDAWGYIREDFIIKPETPQSREEKEKLQNHLEFERWAASQPDWEKKRREQTGRVRHAMGMRPSDY